MKKEFYFNFERSINAPSFEELLEELEETVNKKLIISDYSETLDFISFSHCLTEPTIDIYNPNRGKDSFHTVFIKYNKKARNIKSQKIVNNYEGFIQLEKAKLKEVILQNFYQFTHEIEIKYGKRLKFNYEQFRKDLIVAFPNFMLDDGNRVKKINYYTRSQVE